MKSPLVVNIRCTCIEEYINIQKLHKEYIRQSKEGEITSIYVGAEFAVPGEFEAVDALIAKRGPRQIPCVDFGNMVIKNSELIIAHGNSDGTVTVQYKPEGAQAVDVAEPEPEEKSSISEFAIGDRAEEFHYEDKVKPEEPKPEETPIEEPEVARDIASASASNDFEPRRVPETLVEPDFTQATPSVLEESDDGWNGEDHN